MTDDEARDYVLWTRLSTELELPFETVKRVYINAFNTITLELFLQLLEAPKPDEAPFTFDQMPAMLKLANLPEKYPEVTAAQFEAIFTAMGKELQERGAERAARN